MKIVKIDGYKILHNDAGAPIYCNKRTPTFMPVPSRGLVGGQGMEIATMQGPIHYCGDHCPFFFHSSDESALVEIKCNTVDPLPLTVNTSSRENQLKLT